MDIKHYSIIIQWDNRDKIFIVRVPELPGCISHGQTYEEAFQQGQDAIDSWLLVAQQEGRAIPSPKIIAA
ncbi:MAG TPA: type II toxin-antitoxin system HicB family antitoxin [Ktedonobacteraceae bacterium]|nr:type II toxin-antitoxin system HicB family antitoxin [Ktedonobacteraceae bacterium]